MCIINDDATRNSSKCNDVMKKKEMMKKFVIIEKNKNLKIKKKLK